jgi:hypothetical protein
MLQDKQIDLGEARTSTKAKVFAGRDRGKFWRERFNLDVLDEDQSTVKVIIPPDVISLNISFFLSLFGDSVRRLGREDFLQHYVFESDPVLIPLIEQGVDQALKRSNALAEI